MHDIIKLSFTRHMVHEVLVLIHQSTKLFEIFQKTFSFLKIVKFDKQGGREGPSTLKYDVTEEGNNFRMPKPSYDNFKIIGIIRLNFKILKTLMVTLVPSRHSKGRYRSSRRAEDENQLDIKIGGNCIKLVLEVLPTLLKLLKELYLRYPEFFASYEDHKSNVKKLVLIGFQVLDMVTILSFDCNYTEYGLNTIEDRLESIFEVCFDYLKFMGNDLTYLVQDPKEVLNEIKDIVGSCVSSPNPLICIRTIVPLGRPVEKLSTE